jgi:hypothetical protein
MTPMSEKRRVGEIRPSQLLFTYGIGSIVDLPELSVIVTGLEDWPADPHVSHEIIEPRLLEAIRNKFAPQVVRFRAPPSLPDGGSPTNPFAEVTLTGVPVATFPRWMVCPACRLLASLDAGLFILKRDRLRPNRAYYVHENCNRVKKPTVVPARFLVACEEGHLDDFPWIAFVHGNEEPCAAPLLRLFEQGPSGEARDLTVKCEQCQKQRRLAEAFGRQNRARLPLCTARRPHLRDYDDDGCERHMRPIVLGASNVWFPVVYASIAIPSATAKIDQLVEEQWATLQNATSLEVVTAFKNAGMIGSLGKYPDQEIWAAVERKHEPQAEDDAPDVTDLKAPEWDVLTHFNPGLNSNDFRLNPVSPPLSYAGVIPNVVLVERMREVRAITGFTRLDSPGELTEPGADDEIRSIVPLSRKPPQWLPAVEVRGEGIFIEFAEQKIRDWLGQAAVKRRNAAFLGSHIRWRKVRYIEDPAAYFPAMRYVLLHTFSHALMRQLAMEAGYSSASIRERIYSRNPGDPNGPMAGILLYTAAPDSEGTLGGLVKLGEPDTLERHITAALDAAGLCASDPTCAEHAPSQSGVSLHAAACHACLFVPETSCERGNRYLDRSVLIPTFAQDDLAFFNLER